MHRLVTAHVTHDESSTYIQINKKLNRSHDIFIPYRDTPHSTFSEALDSFSRNQVSLTQMKLFVYDSNETMLYHLLRRVVPLLIPMLWNICATEREIYVSPSGNDSSLCTKDVPCKTIDRGLSLASELNSTRIILAKGNYTMKQSHDFTRMASFGLIGNGSNRDDVRITCDTNVSLSFILSENISFEGIKLRKCGGWRQSAVGMKKHYPDLHRAKFKTVLDFRYCRNLQISNVEISSSHGLGANLYDVGGFVNFADSLFAYNKASKGNKSDEAREWDPLAKYVYSGGGVFILLSRYGSSTVNVTPSEHNSYQHDNQYLFTNCYFRGNEARWSRNSEYKDLNTPELPFSSGGGVSVCFRGNASRCNVAIQACNFTDNQASWGGGLQIETKDKTENNSFVIEGTMFLRNNATLAGGGARIGNTPEKDAQLILNRFHIINCTFANNVAVWGGGASLFGTTIPRKCEKHTDPAITQFYFNGCIWQYNKGIVGAAMGLYLFNYNEDQIGPQIPYRVCFDNDSLFESNEVHVLNNDLTIGQGALYSMEVPLIFKNTTKFLDNSKSALVLDGSTLEIHDQLEFLNNTGFRGGAIAMYGRSRIIFHENSNLTFDGNVCEDKGGAMYIQAPGPPMVSFNATGTNIYTCFFSYFDSSVDYNNWNTIVIFKNNKSPHTSTGKSVYVTTLKSCWQAGEDRKHNSVLRWQFVKFKNLPENFTNFLGEVATDAVDIQLVKSDWEVAPGEVFDATVKLYDEVKNQVPGIIDIVLKTSSVRLHKPPSLFLTTAGKIRNITLCGKEGSIFSVQLNCIGSNILGKAIHGVKLKKCYAGYHFSNSTSMCKCMKYISALENQARGISSCTADRKGLKLKQGYWGGVINVNGTFSTYVCPDGYCNSNNSRSNEYRYVKEYMCNQGRNQSSILCGQCDGNHTITVGSEQCEKGCTYWHLFLLIPFGVVLLLLVMGIMLIDLDVFTGYLNAWLYSYQVMKLLAPDGFNFVPFIEFLIGLTNVQVKFGGRGFCLAKDWDDADKLMVMYAMPVFIIITVVLLTKIIGAFPDWCFSRRVRAPFRGICTIFVLCYTDITYISLRILRSAKVGSKKVLFVNGDIEYFSGKHLYYGIVAIFFIVVFVLPFPMFLLFRPFLTNGLRPVLNLNRWNPFFDALQSCFKDQYRWCAAFYFICRLGLLAIDTFLPASLTKRLLLEGCCILILLIFAVLRPYKEARDVKEDEKSYGWMYISDVVLLTTLSFIAVVSSPIDNSCATTDGVKKGFKIFLNVLSCVPVAVLLVIACCVARKYLPSCKVPLDEETEPIMSQTSVSSRPPSISETPETSETRHSSRGSRSLTGRPQTPSSRYGSIERHTN